MRTLQKVVADYKKLEKDSSLAKLSERSYGFANQEERNKLRDEYVSLLPADKQLAIWLHSQCCRSNHTDGCSFYYGVKGVEDDWSEYTHGEYLIKARRLIDEMQKATGYDDKKCIELTKMVVSVVR